MKEQTLWVIKDPKGRFVWSTIDTTRSGCIGALLLDSILQDGDHYYDTNWKRLYYQGYRATSIQITTEADTSGESIVYLHDGHHGLWKNYD